MNIESNDLSRRAAVHAALGDPVRLAIADALAVSDASPGELGQSLGLPSNLLAHHMRVLQEAGVIRRTRSQGDRRRTYVQLLPARIAALTAPAALPAQRVVFVCTRNSARSQLAAALWGIRDAVPAASAGTHPAARVHRRAIATAHRHGLTLHPARTAHFRDVIRPGDLIVAVCDNAYEELAHHTRLHWSVPDPATAGTNDAFERAFTDIEARVGRLAAAVQPSPSAGHPGSREHERTP